MVNIGQSVEVYSGELLNLIKKISRTAFKCQKSQMLSPGDCDKKMGFRQRVMNKFPDDPVFLDEIKTSDESRLFLKSLPNKQNFCIWSTVNRAFRLVVRS